MTGREDRGASRRACIVAAQQLANRRREEILIIERWIELAQLGKWEKDS